MWTSCGRFLFSLMSLSIIEEAWLAQMPSASEISALVIGPSLRSSNTFSFFIS
jgi:hypothetical protein